MQALLIKGLLGGGDDSPQSSARSIASGVSGIASPKKAKGMAPRAPKPVKKEASSQRGKQAADQKISSPKMQGKDKKASVERPPSSPQKGKQASSQRASTPQEKGNKAAVQKPPPSPKVGK